MKLTAYLPYVIVVSSISMVTALSALTYIGQKKVQLINKTDGDISVQVESLSSARCAPLIEMNIAPNNEKSLDIFESCCVRTIRVRGITGSIKDQETSHTFDVCPGGISMTIRKNNDNRLILE